MTDSSNQAREGAVRLWTLGAGVVVVAGGGFVGYLLYPRFELPASQGLGLLGLAAAAGVAAFFSPCSYPLLITLLAGRTGSGTPDEQPSPALFGAALAAGAALFMTALGVVIAAGGAALFAGVTFDSGAGITIRIVTGIVLVVLGLTQAEILPFSMHRVSRALQPRSRGHIGRRPTQLRRHAVFGFGYVVAGFG